MLVREENKMISGVCFFFFVVEDQNTDRLHFHYRYKLSQGKSWDVLEELRFFV